MILADCLDNFWEFAIQKARKKFTGKKRKKKAERVEEKNRRRANNNEWK